MWVHLTMVALANPINTQSKDSTNVHLKAPLDSSVRELEVDQQDTESDIVERVFDFVATGHLSDAGGATYYFPSMRALEHELQGLMVDSHFDHTTLIQGTWTIFAMENLSSTLSVLESPVKPICEQKEALSGALLNTERLLFRGELDYLTAKVSGKPVNRWTCSHELGQFELLNFDAQPKMKDLPIWDVNDFEFRPAIHLSVSDVDGGLNGTVDIVGRPLQELSRMVAAIEQHTGDYVDVGGFVHGYSSVLDSGLSKHRVFDYEWLDALDPLVLGVGKTEIIAGVNNFLREVDGKELPYIATNLEPPEGYSDISLPKYTLVNLSSDSKTPSQTVPSVLFLSVLDPLWMKEVPLIKEEGWEIQDPSQSLFRVIEEVREQGVEPTAIVVLSAVQSETLRQIRMHGPNVDLLLGDSSLATHRVGRQIIELNDLSRSQKGAPITLPLDGLQQVALSIEENHVKTLEHEPVDIVESNQTNHFVQRQLMANRVPYYPDQNTTLVKLDQIKWSEPLSNAEWEKLLCGVVLSETGADTVLLDGFTAPMTVGSLTEKQVADALAVQDVVEVHRILGKNYGRFLDQAIGSTSMSCGVKPGDKSRKPRGQSIDSNMVYTVATTDQVRLKKDLDLLIQANQSTKWLDPAKTEIQQNSEGKPYYLRLLVLDHLRQHRMNSVRKAPMYSTLTKDLSKPSVQKWWLRLNDVGFTLDSFQSPQVDELSSVPEAMINNPSSAAIGSVVDVTVDRIGDKTKTSFRAQSQYSALYASTDQDEGLTKQETGDDLRLTATWSYTKADWKLGSLTLMPFGELLMDSEWTPLELEGGTFATRQSDLSGTVGLSTKPFGPVKTFKVGGLVNRDLAQLEQKPSEYAGSLQISTKNVLSQALFWTNEGSCFVYGNTPDDDASDLRVRMYGKSKLTMPISTNVGVSVYSTGLLVKGRSTENEVWGHGWNVGASLDLLGTFNL